MDWSPILISMKTASLSIFITFFIGLFAAWAVVSLKNETLKVICDGTVSPDALLICFSLRFSKVFHQNCF